MTMHTIKADPIAWEAALTKYKTTFAAFTAHMASRPGCIPVKLGYKFCKAQEQMMELSAPDIEGVIAKLMALFNDDLDGDSQTGMWKLGVIGDLRRISYGELA